MFRSLDFAHAAHARLRDWQFKYIGLNKEGLAHARALR
jgi:hypothetical protein